MKDQRKVKIVIEGDKNSQFIDWKELLAYKDLLYFLVFKEIAILYKQTILGFSWAIIRPVFSMIVFTIIFGNLADVPSDGVPYPLFSYVALVPWTYFSTAMTKSSLSLVSIASTFTKVYFPRLIIPIIHVISGLVDFLIAFIIIVILMIWYQIIPSVNMLIIPYLILIMVLFTSGIGMFLSSLSIQYRDIKHGIQFISQLLLYATPVVWPTSLLAEKFGSEVLFIYGFYPMAGVIEGFRSALIGTNPIPWSMIISGTISSIIMFIFGAYYFKSKEKLFADVA